jgi:hypothetical protein
MPSRNRRRSVSASNLACCIFSSATGSANVNKNDVTLKNKYARSTHTRTPDCSHNALSKTTPTNRSAIVIRYNMKSPIWPTRLRRILSRPPSASLHEPSRIIIGSPISVMIAIKKSGKYAEYGYNDENYIRVFSNIRLGIICGRRPDGGA